ncbi:MAG: hypothetical protein OXD48_09480, partial [Litoreibacter sp.]|nr:hypothetical protein [Litoreibacter sp.]
MLKKLLQSRIHTPAETPLTSGLNMDTAKPAETKRPPKPVAQGQVKPKSRSMRDSDIKDEHGRSAEEIAAEAAREFDIASVVAKAASMPDAPDQPVRPKTSLISPMNGPKHSADKSRIHVADDPVVQQVAAQAPHSTIVMPDGRAVTQVLLAQAFPAIDPTHPAAQRPATTVLPTQAAASSTPPAQQATSMPVFAAPQQEEAAQEQRPVSKILPSEAPATTHAARPKSRPVSQVLPNEQDTEQAQRPSSRVAPSEPAAPASKARFSKPLELSPSSRVVTPKDKVQITKGHICALGATQEEIYATEDAREDYWECIGESDEELLSYPVTPELRGMPAWPTQMQA